jgi:hypothetical protein
MRITGAAAVAGAIPAATEVECAPGATPPPSHYAECGRTRSHGAGAVLAERPVKLALPLVRDRREKMAVVATRGGIAEDPVESMSGQLQQATPSSRQGVTFAVACR